MRPELSKVLDECIERIRKGETVESCLAEYPNLRKQIKPLLDTALSISGIPQVSPSDEFRKTSKARLMARLRQESIQAEAAKSGRRVPLAGGLAAAWQRLRQDVVATRKVAVPVTIVLLIALGAGLYQFGAFRFLSPTPVLASQCTLSILSGDVEVRNSEAESWRQGADGMLLPVGAQVKTTPDSHALLTFFEGSTIKLNPDTDIEILRLEYDDEEGATIVLKQSMGKSWNRVAALADLRSYYQIETPSASAMARGTLFTVEVDQTGLTQVVTIEGLVRVVAQGEEVQLPPGQQTLVAVETVPSQPVAMSVPRAEILVMIDMPAVGSVSDPTGASTGYLPSGLAYNQITGSQSSSPSDGTQIVTIPEPTTGEYIVVLRPVAQGTANFSITGKSGDAVTFEHAETLPTTSESGWLVHLDLDVDDDGVIVSATVSEVEPLGDEEPENIVETELAKEKMRPITPPGQDKDKNKDEGKDQSSDNNKGKGKNKDDDS